MNIQSATELALELESTYATGLGNRFVARLLRSPMHSLLSPSVCLISYDGHHSGRRYLTPVQYAPWGDSLVILVGHPEQKTWWRNIDTAQGCRAHVMIGRKWSETVAQTYVGADDPDMVKKLCRAYMARFPRAEKTLTTDSVESIADIRFVLCTPTRPRPDI